MGKLYQIKFGTWFSDGNILNRKMNAGETLIVPENALRRIQQSDPDCLDEVAVYIPPMKPAEPVETGATTSDQIEKAEAELKEKVWIPMEDSDEVEAGSTTQIEKTRFVHPRARTLAKENDIDLDTIVGTGKNGSVKLSDVEKAI